MKIHLLLIRLIGLCVFAAFSQSSAQPTCVAPLMSDQQIKAIVDRERSTRTDLPATFPEYRWIVRRQGCHYTYIEYGLPEAFHYEQIFRLNQNGVIIDVQIGEN